MSCFLYQLQFNTPVHFGGADSALSLYSSDGHFRADTLFSALCHTALQLYGESGVARLIELVREEKLRLSDSMPWQKDTLFLPKPYYTAKTKTEQPADKRKLMKKLAWIPVVRYDEYCSAMKTGTFFSCTPSSFGQSFEVRKVSIPDEGDAVPYPVGLYHFHEDAGLYFLVECARETDQQWIGELIGVLGIGGIGGKVSSGYGKFTVRAAWDVETSEELQCRWLRAALRRDTGCQLLLTTSLPTDGEIHAALDGAGFQLVRRAGFIAPGIDPSVLRKKQTQYFLDAGTVLRVRFSGDLYAVADHGGHEVYRYSKPLFLGVEL